ncbi:MAG: hypothetical protein KAH14_01985 [Clostridiales bacterium]|nr:hypothetical protein [Clostridiales bacterium]
MFGKMEKGPFIVILLSVFIFLGFWIAMATGITTGINFSPIGFIFPLMVVLIIFIAVIRVVKQFQNSNIKEKLSELEDALTKKEESDRWISNEIASGENNSDDLDSGQFDYCPYCGVALDTAYMYCPKCGKSVDK